MTVSMKRSRDHDDREVENLAMANCLMLLSRRRLNNSNSNGQAADSFTGRVFRCKTCDREFQSFQALGGHRASHKRHKLISSDLTNHSPSSPSKPKTHACSICGLDFPVGQALGGHMRRHRGEKTAEENNIRLSPVAVPLIRKSVVSKEFLCLDLDLNLTPLENDLKLGNQAGPILQLGF